MFFYPYYFKIIFNQLRQEFSQLCSWEIKEVDSLALANAQLNLDKAYKNFFRDKTIGFPRFKSKKNPVKSYKTNNQKDTVNIIGKFIKIPKLKSLIKIKLHREIKGIIKSATISRVASGKYYVSIYLV